jgi:hypothetical protein
MAGSKIDYKSSLFDLQGKLASDVAACSLGSNSLGITVVDCSGGERAGPKA